MKINYLEKVVKLTKTAKNGLENIDQKKLFNYMAKSTINWTKVKEDFFLDYFATLEDIAKKHHISYSWIRKKSMKEKWINQKNKARKKAGIKAMNRLGKLINQQTINQIEEQFRNK